MNTDRIQLIFFLIIFVAIGILAFFVYLPFMSVLVTAIIFAVVLQPFYNQILNKLKNQSISAALVVVIVAAIIFGLLSLIFTNIVTESKGLYDRATTGKQDYITVIADAIEAPIQAFLPDFTIELKDYADNALNFVRTYAATVLSTTAHTLFYVFLGMVALFFFLRDGKQFRDHLITVSPLTDEIDAYIMRKMKDAINAVVKGTLFIALIQGALVGIGLAIFGVPNPTLWGSLAVICAIIPGVGTAIIGIPAVMYLVLQGSSGPAIGLAIWLLFLVGMIDNFLAPCLYGKGTNIHPILILFSVLGGLAFFGPIGFLFGPLVITLLFVLLHVYRVIVLQADKGVLD
jgi:predicted PurR-regulated permease PerM